MSWFPDFRESTFRGSAVIYPWHFSPVFIMGSSHNALSYALCYIPVEIVLSGGWYPMVWYGGIPAVLATLHGHNRSFSNHLHACWQCNDFTNSLSWGHQLWILYQEILLSQSWKCFKINGEYGMATGYFSRVSCIICQVYTHAPRYHVISVFCADFKRPTQQLLVP